MGIIEELSFVIRRYNCIFYKVGLKKRMIREHKLVYIGAFRDGLDIYIS